MSRAQASITGQSRKSPNGALTFLMIQRSRKLAFFSSKAPRKTMTPRGLTWSAKGCSPLGNFQPCSSVSSSPSPVGPLEKNHVGRRASSTALALRNLAAGRRHMPA